MMRSKGSVIVFLSILGFLLLGIIIHLENPYKNGSLLKLVTEGTNAKITVFITFFSWLAAIINFLLILFLLFIFIFFLKNESLDRISWPLEKKSLVTKKINNSKNEFSVINLLGSKKVFIIALIFSLGISLYNAIPRMNHSLWTDENSTLNYHVHGIYKRSAAYEDPEYLRDRKDGDRFDTRVWFSRIPWLDTLWGYKTTNNHIFFSVLSRSFLDLWRNYFIDDPFGDEFNVFVFRLPSLIAGLLSLFFMSKLIRMLGYKFESILFLIIFPFHPWFVRFLSEGRGYTMLVLFFSLTLIFFIKSIQTGEFRDWLLYGLFQVLLLYTWPGMAISITVLNLTVLFLIYNVGKNISNDWIMGQVFRWFFANMLSVIILFQLFAPCIVQFYGYINELAIHMKMTQNWYKNIYGLMMIGIDYIDFYREIDDENPYYKPLNKIKYLFSDGRLGVNILYVFTIWGVIRFYFHKFGKFLLVCLLTPFVLLQLYGTFKGVYIFNWYYLYALPFFILFLCIGMKDSAFFLINKIINKYKNSNLNKKYIKNIIIILILIPTFILPLVTFFYLVFGQLRLIKKYPEDAAKEAVMYVRNGLMDYKKYAAKDLKTLVGHLFFPAITYDPFGYSVREAVGGDDFKPSIIRLMRWADALDKNLYIILAAPPVLIGKDNATDIIKLIHNKKFFKKEKELFSTNPVYKREIYKYKGGKFPKSKYIIKVINSYKKEEN